jgi:hypothetical protein
MTEPRGPKAPRIPLTRDRSSRPGPDGRYVIPPGPPTRWSPTQASIRSPFNPDPLRPEDDPVWRAGHEVGLAEGAFATPRWRRISALVVGAFLAGAIIGYCTGITRAAPRSGQTTERFDVSPPSSAALSMAPLASASSQSSSESVPSGAMLATPATDGPPSPASRIRIRTGIASWYRDGAGLYAAVPGWRWGDRPYRVSVCARHSDACVTVTVRDFCGCPDRRLIDLSAEAFRRLAPLSLGLVRVSVEGLR